MLNFALCSHVAETEKEFSFWRKFSDFLSRKLNTEIEIVNFKNYLEEKKKALKESYDIYYSNPVISYTLYKRGYKPLARFKDRKDNFVVIGYKKFFENSNTVITRYVETNLLPVLIIENFDFLRTNVAFSKNQSEVYKRVKEGLADFGIMYEETYLEIEDSNKPPVILKISSNLEHTLMVRPEHYEKIKDYVAEFDELKRITEEEFLEGLTEKLPIISFLKTKEIFDVAKAVYHNPYVGIAIYKDTIVYASENIQRILGYSLNELKKLRPQDIVVGNQREVAEEAYSRRLKGEFFFKGYDYVKLRAKSGNYIYAFVFSSTILYQNSYAGLLFIIDVTKEVLFRKFYSILRDVNRAIISVLTEGELFEVICRTLKKELEIKFAWIGVVDEKTNKFKKIYKCGQDDRYLESFNVSKGKNILNTEDFTIKTYEEGEIVINPSVEEGKERWKSEMLKRNFLSSVSVPIMKNGKVYAVLNIYSPVSRFFDNSYKGLLEGLSRDVSFALEKIDSIKKSVILENLIEKATEWVIITDRNGKIEYVNDYVCKISGYSKEELLGKRPSIFKSGYHNEEFYKKLWETISSGKEFVAVFVDRAKSGKLFYLEQKIVPVALPEGEVKFVGIGRDITVEKILLEENERLKYYDVLTGLYNFNGFSVHVEDFLSKNPDTLSALLILDIANFSYINKTFGSDFGDEVLRKITEILRSNVKRTDIIGRIGGDEFGIFLKDLPNKRDLFLIIERIKDILNRYVPLKVGNRELNLVIHGGIAVYPDDGRTFKELLQNAIVALKAAKRSKGSDIRIFNKKLEKKIGSFLVVNNLLFNAVRKKLFLFHYQPYFDIKSKELVGFEALVRIRDENGILHYPGEFIDVLEQSNYLSPFREWALKEVSEKIKRWKKPISVNISARTFKNPNFPKQVLEYVKELPAPMVLEITERLYMSEIEKSKEIIKELRKCKNLKISIDDFGTGYSSLSYLMNIDADIIKIDISFVRKMVKDERSRIIVKAIVTLAKELNMKTVAEGVETEEQFEIVKSMGIDYVQGFLFSKPLPEEEVDKLLGN